QVAALRVQGAIDPATERYVAAGIRAAEAQGAAAVVIELDTPGGLDSSMRAIVQAMTRSPLPVIVYVGPSGARAASAGVFLSYAADVLAMAPNTNIGAAHPVALQGEIPSVEAEKLIADAAAYLRSLAQATGRNADWGAQAVRQSVSASATEARDLHVADLIATDRADLLRQLQGRQLTKLGRAITLETAGAATIELDMSLPEQLVHALVNPAITYLLLAVAVWALIAEFSAPGISVPGIIGLVCLVLFAVSASILPINWAGVVLILAAIIFFVADIKAPTHGVLTAGGISTFVVGSLLLFRPVGPVAPISLPQAEVWRAPGWLIAVVVGLTAAIFSLAVLMGIKAQKLAPGLGRSSLTGAAGRVTSASEVGATAQIRGELWTVRAAEGELPIVKGDIVRVVDMDGLTLIVRKA
ncbi:MAG: nodulation protein NfeD, partial [Chloroflexota bacterium]